MITICVPIYNFDVNSLINKLLEQAKTLEVPCEIIVIDDCSNLEFRNINKPFREKVKYIQLEKNIGRSKIRNLFLNEAQYSYLLFLDCDSLIISPDFLLKYLEIIKLAPSVVCGGRVYDKEKPSKDKLLRWKYGIFKESKTYDVRQKFPNKSFMTNNFLIDKTIFSKVKFDERIAKYGHEDTLFGFELKKQNIIITHINNPILNGDLETNTEFIKKTQESIENLVDIIKFMNYDKNFTADISLFQFYNIIKPFEIIIKLIFKSYKIFIIKLLEKDCVNLYLFDFYKLGLFTELISKTENAKF